MKKIVSIVAPAYNEELVIEIFYKTISNIMNKLDTYDYEILIVNDGSKDKTPEIIRDLCEKDGRVSFVNLSRNYGHEVAVAAGLDHACGDIVILMDADLQDSPEIIPDMIRLHEQGYDIVNAKRRTRDGETWLKKATAKWFYQVFSSTSNKVKMPQNVGNFRLISRRAVDAFKELRESHRFARGLFCWVGFPTTEIEFDRAPRVAGTTKYNYKTMINYAIEGLTSFSIAPLRIATYLGIISAILSVLYAIYVLFLVFTGNPNLEKGWSSIVLLILIFGSTQLIVLGILGEYLGRIFNETKNRPLYFVQEYISQEVQRNKE